MKYSNQTYNQLIDKLWGLPESKTWALLDNQLDDGFWYALRRPSDNQITNKLKDYLKLRLKQ